MYIALLTQSYHFPIQTVSAPIRYSALALVNKLAFSRSQIVRYDSGRQLYTCSHLSHLCLFTARIDPTRKECIPLFTRSPFTHSRMYVSHQNIYTLVHPNLQTVRDPSNSHLNLLTILPFIRSQGVSNFVDTCIMPNWTVSFFGVRWRNVLYQKEMSALLTHPRHCPFIVYSTLEHGAAALSTLMGSPLLSIHNCMWHMWSNV